MPRMYNRLRGRITEKYGTISAFCEDFGISRQAMSLKLNGVQDFTYDQIVRSCALLDIQRKDIGTYFFCPDSSQM